jgi:signal transduction histidine kinase
LSDDHVVAERLLAERAERRRIAEQLHDGPVQHVAALCQMLDAADAALQDGDVASGQRVVARALVVAREAAEHLREIVAGLEPVMLDEIGLAAAVRELAERTAGRRGATLDVAIEDEGLGGGARSSLFQVVREALDQAIRRGPPSAVSVSLTRTRSGGVELVVSDDGAPERRQAVIDGLAERAAELNGSLEASRDGRWTRIRLVVPPSATRL